MRKRIGNPEGKEFATLVKKRLRRGDLLKISKRFGIPYSSLYNVAVRGVSDTTSVQIAVLKFLDDKKTKKKIILKRARAPYDER